MTTIGVLALQGDVREHLRMLEAGGVRAEPVRRYEELLSVDGLVIPGGESTTMVKLATAFDLLKPLRKRIRDGMPTMGTCAGMIMLADTIVDGIEGQEGIGGIDMVVRRNAFGRQVDSFEADLEVDGLQDAFRAVFIRAPWVENVGERAQVLARVASGPAVGRIVAVRQDRLVAMSFHPELTGDTRIHDFFVRLAKEA